MRIGIDIMGGDYAPLETIKGAIEALSQNSSLQIVLIGKKEEGEKIMLEQGGNPASYTWIDAHDVIEMSEHPTKAFQQKPNSSITVGFGLLKKEMMDAFASAGNTGAMLVGSMFSVKPIQGILRPAISTLVPKLNGGFGLLLDVGVNADCRPEMMQQFAILGSLYAEHVRGIANPKVGLVSIGEEEEKGNALTLEAHKLIKETKGINFIGNVEGRDLFNDRADVIVCDGFTGNIILKLVESFYDIMEKRKLMDDYVQRLNYENYGGNPILGINGAVIMGHGISNDIDIK